MGAWNLLLRSRLNLARNEFQNLDLSGRSVSVQTLDISGNPLPEVVISAGLETVTPRVEVLRRSGIGVDVPLRLRALRSSPEGRARFELFADAGSYLVQRSEDLRQWRTVGEVEVAQSLWPAVFFEGDSTGLGAATFYSVTPSFVDPWGIVDGTRFVEKKGGVPLWACFESRWRLTSCFRSGESLSFRKKGFSALRFMKSEEESVSQNIKTNKGRSGGLRLFLAGLLGLFLLLLGGLFIATRSWFVTSFVLPSVGGAIHSTLEAGSISGVLSSDLVVEKLQLTPFEEPSLLSIRKLSFTYDPMAMFRGSLVARNLEAEGVEVDLILKPDGSLNVDPVLGALMEAQPEETAPLLLDLTQIKITDSRIRFRREGDPGGVLFELMGLEAELDRLANAETSNLDLKGQFRIRMGDPASELVASVEETVTIQLNEALLPVGLETALVAVVQRVEGAFADFADNQLTLAVSLRDQRLEPLSVELSRSGQRLGRLNASGSLDILEASGQLDFAMTDVHPDLLNQFRDFLGFSFGAPTLSIDGGIAFGLAGQTIAVDALLRGQALTIENQMGKAPELGFELSFAVSADSEEAVYRIEKLKLESTQGERPLLSAKTDRPFSLKWGGDKISVSPAQLAVGLEKVNLSEWRPLLGEAASGTLASELSVLMGDDREGLLRAKGRLSVADWVSSDTPGLASGLGGAVQFEARVQTLAQFKVPQLDFQVWNGNGPLLSGQGSLGRSGAQEVSMQADIKAFSQGHEARQGLDFKVVLAGKLAEENTELGELRLTLPATEKALENGAALSGEWVLSEEGVSGSLHLAATTLDVTPVLDFVGGAQGASEEEEENEAESIEPAEPAPIRLPFKNLKATVQADQLFAREMVITEGLMHVELTPRGVKVAPLELALNGAPLKGAADLDLSVPGYRYDLELKAEQVAADPLIASLSPTLKGVYDGRVNLGLDLAGAGLTGASIRKSLKGAVEFEMSESKVELVPSWRRVFFTPIATVLRMPEMLNSPISGFSLRTVVDGGTLNVGAFQVSSQQFRVASNGEIPIADRFMSSVLAFPIDLSLRKELAVKANLVESSAPDQDGYVALPKFVQLEGALGEPAVRIDKKAVGKLFLRNVAGIPGAVAGKAEGALKDLVEGEGKVKDAAGKLIDGAGGLLNGAKGASLKDAGNALRGLFNRIKDSDQEE